MPEKDEKKRDLPEVMKSRELKKKERINVDEVDAEKKKVCLKVEEEGLYASLMSENGKII